MKIKNLSQDNDNIEDWVLIDEKQTTDMEKENQIEKKNIEIEDEKSDIVKNSIAKRVDRTTKKLFEKIEEDIFEL